MTTDIMTNESDKKSPNESSFFMTEWCESILDEFIREARKEIMQRDFKIERQEISTRP